MKNKNTKQTEIFIAAAFFVVLISVLAFAGITKAAPVSVGVSSNSTDTGPSFSYSRDDDGGTITTINYNVTQQSETWKGYVGNITGTLALRDSANYSIYQWDLGTITGEVYASRASSVTWANINCSNDTILATEYGAINMADSDIDSINKTFNETTHPAVTVGALTIIANSCNTTSTYVNNTRQGIAAAYFKEVLLDDDSNIIYSTILRNNIHGYNTAASDFQLIVPDSDAAATQTTYYFWAEIE